MFLTTLRQVTMVKTRTQRTKQLSQKESVARHNDALKHGRENQEEGGNVEARWQTWRKVAASKKKDLTGETKTIVTLTSTSADIRGVLLAELQQNIAECESCCLNIFVQNWATRVQSLRDEQTQRSKLVE